jgi:hypothetical protein
MLLKPHKILFLCIAVLGISALNVSAATVFATTVNNELVSFDSETTCTIDTNVSISGLQDGEDILGIDFRPSNGLLYALGSTSRIYTINTTTGVATVVGSGPFTPLISGDSFGFDFNPRAGATGTGLIRIISNTGQSLRINPDTGATAGVDTNLSFAAGDPNFGASPTVAGSAYTNSRVGVAGTMLFNLDSGLDSLLLQNTAPTPNNGINVTVGTFGLNTNDLVGFDILTTGTITSPVNTGYAAFKESGKTRDRENQCGNSSLFTIDLATGEANYEGSIGTKQPIRGLAVALVTLAL